jgi:hypothetical protein
LADSATAASNERRRWSGGTITPRGEAWVEFDPRARAVHIRGQRFAAVGHDSVLVILVDDTAGSPIETHIETRALPPVVSVDRVRATLTTGESLVTATMEREHEWNAALGADLQIMTFLGSESPALAPY